VTNQATDEISVELLPIPAIQKRILVVRDRQVMLDEDLAELYGVETRRLTEQVKRNIERFPEDFMFQLTKDEAAILRSQSATSSGHGGRRYPPYVFTEQGVAMLSGVLRSRTAIAVNIAIMRAFVDCVARRCLTRRSSGASPSSSARARRGSANTTSSSLTSSRRCDN
jgi:hypothetical protein